MQEVANLLPLGGVGGHRRLVHQQQSRLTDQRSRERDARAFAWAQLERMDVDRHSLGRLRKIAAALGCRLTDLTGK